jgi:uncharacterized delta-60 repeat protein
MTLVMAAPGVLDSDFGDGGLVSLHFSEFGSAATALAQQPDGKLIVAGLGDVVLSNDDDVIVVRLQENGQLDASFGSAGVATADFAGFFDAAFAVRRQADGKLVVAGTVGVTAIASDFALARFNADGTLDSTFGTGGWATLDLGGSDEIASGLVEQPSGKWVVAGHTNSEGTLRAAVARFNGDGTLDTSFGTAGATLLDFGSGSQFSGYDLARQQDGKLVVAGTVFLGSDAPDVGIARLSAEGALDTTFGSQGRLAIDDGTSGEEGFAMAIQPDDAIVVAGYTFVPGGGYAKGLIARVSKNGTLDVGFGIDGIAAIDLGAETIFYAVGVQPNGRLVTAGYRLSSELYTDMIMARFGSDGAIDGEFGTDGVATADFGAGDVPALSWANALLRQFDGKHVAAGYNFDLGAFVVARFAEDGAAPGRIGLTATSRVVDESVSTVTYTVRRTGGSSGAVSVNYATAAIGAQPGSDFANTSGTLDWNDGEADEKPITIDIVDDTVPEQPEDFSLTLSAPTGGARMAASEAMTRIISEDGPGELALVWPFWLDDQHVVSEGVGTVSVPVVRHNGSTGAVSVQYLTNRGSATAGSDFVAASGTLTWADGDTEVKNVEVEILDDGEAENLERFDIQIAAATGGATIGSARQNVFIRDNEPGGAPPPPSPPPPAPQPPSAAANSGGGALGFLSLLLLLAARCLVAVRPVERASEPGGGDSSHAADLARSRAGFAYSNRYPSSRK